MQTRSGKIYTIRGKYHVATGPLLDSQISKVLLEIRTIRSGIAKIPKIAKFYRIINDNFDDKMAIWDGGKLHYYDGLNRMIFDKTFEFEEKIQQFLEKSHRENKHVNKRRGWNDAIKQLHLYRSKYKNHKAVMLLQIQDWIGSSTSTAHADTVSSRDRIDGNIASTVLSYLYKF